MEINSIFVTTTADDNWVFATPVVARF